MLTWLETRLLLFTLVLETICAVALFSPAPCPSTSISHHEQVLYDAEGFLEKNRDTLSSTIVNVLKASRNTLIHKLFSSPMSRVGSFIKNDNQTCVFVL
jgi:hypothetical protein